MQLRRYAQGPVELPPQVLQAVQQQLAAEQEMAAQQKMAHQNRRFPPQAQIIPDSAEQVFIQEEVPAISPDFWWRNVSCSQHRRLIHPNALDNTISNKHTLSTNKSRKPAQQIILISTNNSFLP